MNTMIIIIVIVAIDNLFFVKNDIVVIKIQAHVFSAVKQSTL